MHCRKGLRGADPCCRGNKTHTTVTRHNILHLSVGSGLSSYTIFSPYLGKLISPFVEVFIV